MGASLACPPVGSHRGGARAGRRGRPPPSGRWTFPRASTIPCRVRKRFAHVALRCVPGAGVPWSGGLSLPPRAPPVPPAGPSDSPEGLQRWRVAISLTSAPPFSLLAKSIKAQRLPALLPQATTIAWLSDGDPLLLVVGLRWVRGWTTRGTAPAAPLASLRSTASTPLAPASTPTVVPMDSARTSDIVRGSARRRREVHRRVRHGPRLVVRAPSTPSRNSSDPSPRLRQQCVSDFKTPACPDLRSTAAAVVWMDFAGTLDRVVRCSAMRWGLPWPSGG